MNPYRPLLTQHRLQRFVLWTLTMLSWIAAILCDTGLISHRHIRQRRDGMSLAWLRRRVVYLLIIRAAQLVHWRRKRIHFWRRGRDIRPPHLIRSLLGTRLRRALRHRDPRVWVAQLIHVLRNLDAYAAPIIKRMNGRLTRVVHTWAPTRLEPAPLGTKPAAPAFADSS